MVKEYQQFFRLNVDICGHMNPIQEDYQHGRVDAKAQGQCLRLQSPGCVVNTISVGECREGCLHQ